MTRPARSSTSVETGSPPETIFVRLLDEGLDVWRPVQAQRLDADLFRLVDGEVPDEERWEFGPGTVVRSTLRAGSEGPMWVAVGLADARQAG